MQHSIPRETLDPLGQAMADAVSACVHCGFCLPVCPTYITLGQEMDSPRGRIVLMKEMLEGGLALEEGLPHVDRCLGCVGCISACPSGVAYGELRLAFQAQTGQDRRRSLGHEASRRLVRETLPYPGRFRVAAAAGKLVRPLRDLLPEGWVAGRMLDLLPQDLPAGRPLPYFYPARGPRRARVALLAGCVQPVLDPDINWATLRVLARNGVEVVVPQDQGCCGALSMHGGDLEQARRLARRNLQAFPADVDAVITNAAGCGSGMHEYELLFRGQPEEERAGALAGRTQDITVFLDGLGIEAPPALSRPFELAYHDACHLAHAQGVREAPRRLLRSIPGLKLLEIAEGDICCGSAGTYNLEQPAIARELGQRKAANILASGAEALATGNIGCLTQIQTHLQALGRPLPLYHTIQVLDRAYAGMLA